MNVNEITVGQVKDLLQMFQGRQEDSSSAFQPFEIGKDYLIRTVTHIDIGTVVSVGPIEIIMVNASWIGDTGRYADAFKCGSLNEVEPYPDDQEVIIGRGAIIDATRWTHPLPRTQV